MERLGIWFSWEEREYLELDTSKEPNLWMWSYIPRFLDQSMIDILFQMFQCCWGLFFVLRLASSFLSTKEPLGICSKYLGTRSMIKVVTIPERRWQLFPSAMDRGRYFREEERSRGTKFPQIPPTLLYQVDQTIGGSEVGYQLYVQHMILLRQFFDREKLKCCSLNTTGVSKIMSSSFPRHYWWLTGTGTTQLLTYLLGKSGAEWHVLPITDSI